MIHWLIRAKRWAHKPPSMGQVKFILAIIAVCLAIGAYEYMFGWPDALTTNEIGRRGVRP